MFLTGEMEDRVIPDTMNHVYLPQGRYPAKFCDDIFIGSVSGRGGLRRGLLGGRYGFLTGDMEDSVILDTMDDLGRPQG